MKAKPVRRKKVRIDAVSIIERLRTSTECESDAALCRLLGVDTGVLSNWKRRGTIDINLVLSKCVDVDYNYILTGKKPQQIASEGKTKDQLEIEKALVETCGKFLGQQEMAAQIAEKYGELCKDFGALREQIKQVEAENERLRQPTQSAKAGMSTAYLRSPAVPGG